MAEQVDSVQHKVRGVQGAACMKMKTGQSKITKFTIYSELLKNQGSFGEN